VKSKFIGYFAGTIFMLIFASVAYYKYDHYDNDQPIPEHEISITGVPLTINTVMGEYRGKSYIIGYRILLSDYNNSKDEYVVISTTGALLEANKQISGSPGMVPKATTESFAEVVKAIGKTIMDKMPIGIYGDILYDKKKDDSSFSFLSFLKDKGKEGVDESLPLLFEGKKVVLLYSAKMYSGERYEINRRPKDNDH
jgi:hypothetical protein